MLGVGIRERFARELRRALVQLYGRIPAADTVARDFTHFGGAGDSITRETARKWMRGIAFPDLDRLARLIAWLGLDMSHVFHPPRAHSAQGQHKLPPPPPQWQRKP